MDQDKMDESFYISKLIAKMLKGELSMEEKNSLDAWVVKHPDNAGLLQKLIDEAWRNDQANVMQSFDTEAALTRLNNRMQEQQPIEAEIHTPRRSRFYWAAAAAVIAIITISVFYFLNSDRSPAGKQLASIKKTNSGAGSGKILLTLADGTVIDLQATDSGEIGRQGNTVISKTGENILDYSQHAAAADSEKTAINTLTIPAGMKYQLRLPDGTHVWLNAQTTIKYPALFAAAERMVELDGEAYFEVKEKAAQPFKVKTKAQQIQVLGTELNVSAYSGDPVTATTLVGGAVRVSGGAASQVLRPGQKASVSNKSGEMSVASVDVDDVLAWKNGFLNFSDDRIEDIMRQVARVYNIEIEYKGEVKDRRFWGRFPVDKGLMNLLRNLEQTKTIHFKLDGRKLIVSE